MPQRDPYGQDMQSPTVTQEILGYLNPVELAKFKYTTYPSVYGGSFLGVSKGVWMPIKFQDINLSKYSRNVRAGFKGGVWKGIGAAASPLRSAWDSNNYIGGGYLRRSQQINRFTSDLDNTLFSYFDKMRQQTGMRPKGLMNRFRMGVGQSAMTAPKYGRVYSASKAGQLSQMFRQDIVDWLDEAGDLSKASARGLREKITSRVSAREFIGTYGDMTDKVDDIIAKVGGRSYGTSIKGAGFTARTINEGAEGILAKARSAGLAGAVGKIGSGTAKFAGAARLGLFAAKGFAAIGAISMLWDITQAIAKPVGNMLVHEGNRVMDNFHARFMPELGGRMAMSYMSTGAATERQRAVQAISKAYINGRSAFGQEAMYAHG